MENEDTFEGKTKKKEKIEGKRRANQMREIQEKKRKEGKKKN